LRSIGSDTPDERLATIDVVSTQEFFQSLLVTFKQREAGVAPWSTIRSLSDADLDAYFSACGRLRRECPTDSYEHQVGGGVIRGWLSQEITRRRNCREFPAIFGPA
jgi:hypothetical protein